MVKCIKKLFNSFILWIKGLKKGRGSIHYVNGGDGLPQPFSREEEEDRIYRLLKGEEGIRKQLIEHNLRLVVYIARKFDNTGIDLDDLISVGTIGLIKAVNTFNAEKKIKLATYASRCIENEILMYLRKIVKLRSEVSLDEPLNVDYEGNELLLSDVLGTDDDSVFTSIESSVDEELLKKALLTLPQRERQIMQLRFGLYGADEMTQKEVADMLGISQSYISRLEKKIVKKLRKEINKML